MLQNTPVWTLAEEQVLGETGHSDNYRIGARKLLATVQVTPCPKSVRPDSWVLQFSVLDS